MCSSQLLIYPSLFNTDLLRRLATMEKHKLLMWRLSTRISFNFGPEVCRPFISTTTRQRPRSTWTNAHADHRPSPLPHGDGDYLRPRWTVPHLVLRFPLHHQCLCLTLHLTRIWTPVARRMVMERRIGNSVSDAPELKRVSSLCPAPISCLTTKRMALQPRKGKLRGKILLIAKAMCKHAVSWELWRVGHTEFICIHNWGNLDHRQRVCQCNCYINRPFSRLSIHQRCP